MEYIEFLESKRLAAQSIGFSVCDDALPSSLFDWQRHVVRWACQQGRAALFADTGLGKTAMQLAWANAVASHTNGRVLILAPLAVAAQTAREGARIGVRCDVVRDARDLALSPAPVVVCNYDRLHLLESDQFVGVVLDESSILKAMTGQTRRTLTATFAQTPYRLACTATPAPNDFVEFGTHSEWLGVLTQVRMLARFFINDLSDTGTFRLKKHAARDFWTWMASWAVALRTPADLLGPDGTPYDGVRYVLPPLDIQTHVVAVDHTIGQETSGELFRHGTLSATTMHAEMRLTANDRAARVAEIVMAEPDEPWVIWCNTDYEADAMRAALPGVVEVHGRMTADQKESALNDFSDGLTRWLLTKPSIAGFGMNWQHCARMAFVGLSYSYESLYQALRRSYRFGQSRAVVAHLVHAESEGGVMDALTRKEAQHKEMQSSMVAAMRDVQGGASFSPTANIATGRVERGDDWTLTNGDCVEVFRSMPDSSIDFSVYSPPFANLYVYTDDPRDMGNVADDSEFSAQYAFLIAELFRVTRDGRLSAVHVSQLPQVKWKDGTSGLRDFRGDVIRAHQAAGWVYHSEVCIWKDPVTEMQRTKSHGLLYKTIRTNAAASRVGMPDYLVVFRKPGGEDTARVTHTPEDFPLDLWQRVASPVWMDIDQTRTLNARIARSEKDEKHLCPLQLDVIERAINLWTNKGDVVASPFTGIGSEGVSAIKMGRRFVGAELKPEYFQWAVRHLREASAQSDLFGCSA